MKPALTELQESLLILAALNSQLEWAVNALTRNDRIKDEDLKFTVCNHIIILLCSFLEEMERLVRLGRDDKVRDTLQVISPALRRIRRWTGISKVRSSLLAHGHRGKDRNPAWAWDVFASHNAPTSYAEIILLAKCANLAVKKILTRHQLEYREATSSLSSLPRNIEDRGIRTMDEINSALATIDSEMVNIERSVP